MISCEDPFVPTSFDTCKFIRHILTFQQFYCHYRHELGTVIYYYLSSLWPINVSNTCGCQIENTSCKTYNLHHQQHQHHTPYYNINVSNSVITNSSCISTQRYLLKLPDCCVNSDIIMDI